MEVMPEMNDGDTWSLGDDANEWSYGVQGESYGSGRRFSGIRGVTAGSYFGAILTIESRG